MVSPYFPARWGIGFAGLCFVLIVPLHPARGLIEGIPPRLVRDFELFGSHSSAGAPLMVPDIIVEEISSVLLPESSAILEGMPFDHRVEAAYLFWSGATPRTNRSGPPDGPDFDVDLTTADGTFYNDLSVFDHANGFDGCVQTDDAGGYYYCRREVTDLIANQGPGNASGTYTVGDVRSDAGTLDFVDPQAFNAQAKFAGWSLLVVWSSETEEIKRNVVLYDGFARLDENATSSGQISFNIGNFAVGSPALGKLSIFALEGDDQLGVPPQDISQIAPCPTCFDFVSFRSQSAGAATKLSNGNNPPNNAFNSSTSAGLDIDTYDLSGLIRTGDTNATVTVSSGDGVVPGGGGESFFVGWLIMSIDTLTPRFRSVATKKTVSASSANAGQSLFYTLDVANDGSETATNVSLRDPLPAGTDYIPGTTRVDGTPVADVGAQSPLENGLSLGNVPHAAVGDHTRQVTFQVRVDPAACGGSVSNQATLSADGIEDVTLGPALTTVNTAAIEPPTMTVGAVGSPSVGPGGFLNYQVEFPNGSGQDIGGSGFEFPVPPFVTVTNAFASSGTVSVSATEVSVQDFEIAENGTSQITIFARVLDESELLAAGLSADDIDGLLVSAQGIATGGCGPPELTDGDDSLAGPQPTEFALVYRPAFSTSDKQGSDINGGILEPEDEIQYLIRVANTGNRAGTVDLRDTIPAQTRYVPGSTFVDGAPRSDVGGNFPFVAGGPLGAIPASGTRTIAFRVKVDAMAPNGTAIANVADVTVAEEPSENRTLTSSTLRVVAAPVLTTSSMVVQDLGPAPFEPGDRVEYTIVLENSGNRPATSLVVENVLPPELRFVSANAGGVFSSGSLTWTLSDLARDSSVTLSVVADVVTPLANGALVRNLATVRTAEIGDFDLEASFSVTSAPIFRVTKAAEFSSTPVRPGDRVTYRIRIENAGNAVAENVEVTDVIDPSLVDFSSPSGRLVGQSILFDSTTDSRLLSIAPGVSGAVELLIEASIRSPVANGTLVSNTATVSALNGATVDSDDPNVPGQNPTTFVVVSDVDVLVSKGVRDLSPSTPFSPGDRVEYELNVRVDGTSTIEGARLIDTLPLELGNASVRGATLSGRNVVADFGVLVPGDTRSVTIQATINAVADGTLVRNQASFESSTFSVPQLSDGQPSVVGDQPTEFSVVAEATADATLSVERVGGPGPIRPGESVRYTLVINNSGNVSSGAVSVEVPLASSLTLVDLGGGVLQSGLVRWTSSQVSGLAAVRPGEPVTIVFEARVVTPLDNGTEVSLQGVVDGFDSSASTDDPTTSVVGDATRFSVVSAPVVDGFTKTVEDLSGDAAVTRAGDTVRYRLLLRNSGDAVARNVVVRDPIDADLSPVDPGNATLTGGALIWDQFSEPDLAALAPGEEIELVFDAQVSTDASNGQRVANQATLTAGALVVLSDDPATAEVDDSTDVFVSGDTDLGATTKRVVDSSGRPIDSAEAGSEVEFLITVTNRGTDPATGVQVTDALDSGFTLISAPDATVSGQTLNWSVGSLGAGDSRELRFSVRLGDSLTVGTVLLNQATIAANELVGPIESDFDLTTPTKEPTPLEIVGSSLLTRRIKQFIDPSSGEVIRSASPGAPVRIEIELDNSGTDAADDVEVIDDLDTTILTNIVVRDGGVLVDDRASWSGITIPAGSTARLRIDARLRPQLDNDPLVNQAFLGVGGASPQIPTDDPSIPGDADPTVLEIDSPPDLDNSTKTALLAGNSVEPGDEFSYRIEVSNSGTGTARDVVIEDPLDPLLEFVAVSDGGAFDVGSRTVVVNLPDLAPGAQRAVTVTVRADPGIATVTDIANQATIRAGNAPSVLTDDPIAGSDRPTIVTVVAGPLLAFSKSVRTVNSPPFVGHGARLQYEFEVANLGNAPATDVRITDRLDTSLLENFELPNGGLIAADQLTFSASTNSALSAIAPGETVQLLLLASVRETAANDATISNHARLTSNELPEPLLSDDPSTPEIGDSTDIQIQFPELVLTKDVERVEPVMPGDSLIYTLRLRNDGVTAATNVVVRDVLPPELIDVVLEPSSAGVSAGVAEWSESGVPGLGRVQPGEAFEFTIRGTVDPSTGNGTSVRNQGFVVGDGTDQVSSDWPETDEPDDPTSVEVQVRPDVRVSKVASDDDGVVSPGESLTYTLEIVNQGVVPVEELVLSDRVPESLEVVSASDAILDGQLVQWSFAELLPGDRQTVELATRVRLGTPNAEEIVNQGELTARNLPDPLLTDDPGKEGPADPTTVSVSAVPSLKKSVLVARDLNGGSVQPGDRIQYELRVHNDGTAASIDTVVQVPLPSFTRYVPGTTTLNGAPLQDISTGNLAGLSRVVDGAQVTSVRADTGLGVILPDDGVDPSDEDAIVRFEVQVDPQALAGTVIKTQAHLLSDGFPRTLSDDCTRLLGVNCEDDPAFGEATVLIVGGGATFAVDKRWILRADLDDDGLPSAGDRIRYEMTVVNAGSVLGSALVLEDPIPVGASLISGTLTLDGQVLSEAGDGDAGSVDESLVRVELPDLESGDSSRVTFDVTVGEVSVLENQAFVLNGGQTFPSDGDPQTPGAQVTRTIIDRSQPHAVVTLEAIDRSGGRVEPGDSILYRLSVLNDGAVDLQDAVVRLDRDAVFDASTLEVRAPDGVELLNEGPLTWRANIPVGGRVVLELEGQLLADLQVGRAFDATAVLPELGLVSDPARLVVGGGAGSALLEGLVFIERGERNGVFNAERDQPLNGFTVALIPESRDRGETRRASLVIEPGSIRSVWTGADGRFRASGVPSGRYRVIVLSREGTYFAELADPIEVDEGRVEVQDIAVDPSGIIYEMQEGSAVPVDGAQVFLVDERTGNDVEPTLLAAGQQGQVTTGQGFYRFDLRSTALPGDFRLRVVPPPGDLFFPSGQRVPVGGTAFNPFGEPAPPGRVSTFDFPEPNQDPNYHLRFSLTVDTEDVTNNHVPLDRLSDVLRLTKQVNRRRASVGEILTYTITITNPLTTTVGADAIGPRLVDLLPVGLQWPTDRQAFRTTRDSTGNVIRNTLPVLSRTARTVEFATFDLPAQSTTTIRYYAIVGLRASGELVNRAYLRSASNLRISNEGTATVRVVDDPIFDQGTVLGRVFCDSDRDGRLDDDETGLPGARVYLDTGFYVDSDHHGKFHFRGVRPGRHVIKVDPNTLPPESQFTTDRLRDFIVTRGLLAKIDFGVHCGWESVTLESGRQSVQVLIDRSLPGVSLNGRVQDVVLVDGMLNRPGDDVDFSGPGISRVQPDAPMEWRMSAPSRNDIARWSISVFSDDPVNRSDLGSGELQEWREYREVWRVEANGAPPARLPVEWGNTLTSGRHYIYRVALETDHGDQAEGRWRRFYCGPEDPGGDKESASVVRAKPHVIVNGTTLTGNEPFSEARLRVAEGDEVRVDVRQTDGRRTVLRRRFPFATVEAEAERDVSLEFTGDLKKAEFEVSGSEVELALYRSTCALADSGVREPDSRLNPPARFTLESSADVTNWIIRIFNSDGTVLTDLAGEKIPEGAIEWPGTNAAGNPVAKSESYRFRCLLSDSSGGRLVGPMETLQVSDRSTTPADGDVILNRTFSGNEYPDTELNSDFGEALVQVAQLLRERPSARVDVEVHDWSDGGRVRAQMRTVRLASVISKKLETLGIDAARFRVDPQGSNSPIMPGRSRFAKQQNRRVTLVVRAPETHHAQEKALTEQMPIARVGGIDFDLNHAGEFSGSVVSEIDGPLLLEFIGPDGRRLVRTLEIRAGRPVGQHDYPLRAGDPTGRGTWIGSSPEMLFGSPGAAARPTTVGHSAAAQVSPQAVEATDERAPPPRETGPEDKVDTRVVRTVEQSLTVWMPRDGARLNGERLTVKGRAPLGTKVLVNGQPARLDATGEFSHSVQLSPGEVSVDVQGEFDGDVVGLTRTYTVPDYEWFLLAMADTALGSGEPIVGMNDDTRREFDHDVYLHGRALAYFKGRLRGDRLIESSPFEDLRLTAHVDTGKQNEPELLRQLIDPDRYFPVYGDATEEIQDVRSREKLYLSLEADKSKLQVGNFRAELTGQQLFQYQRTFFGANLEVDHVFVPGTHTQVKAFAADGGAGTRHRQLVFQGTGGAMYFLRDDALVEGSERVQLVVRDTVSGARLMTIPQRRDVDYTMQYRDGRLLFMQPIPSTVTANWSINQNPVRTLEGHRVFVEIEYDYESFLAEDSEDAYAAQVRHQFANGVVLGGGFVQEEREGSRYRLLGTDARAQVFAHTEVSAEFAYSEAIDIDTLASFDGGVTFGRIGSQEQVLRVGGASPVDGWAGTIAIRGDAQDWAAVLDQRPAPQGRKVRFPYELSLQRQTPGFYSGTNVLEQGQTKFGAQLRAVLTDIDAVRFRHDSIWSTVYAGDFQPQNLTRQISGLGYERKGEGWSAGTEVGHTHSVINRQNSTHRATVNVFGRYEVTPRLTLLGEQEFTGEFSVESDSPASEQRLQGTADQFATTLGAEYMLNDALSITGSESLRWSGTNSAQVGLRARISEDVNVYGSERFTTVSGGTVSTLVVGAESTAIPGSRSYGEYQLDHLASGESGRAVFGMENGWTVTEGLKLLLSYERSQLVSDSAPNAMNSGFAINSPGITGTGSGAFSRDQQFSASSYAGGGVFPTGVASRDSLSVGAEYLPHADFKLSSRFDLRFDRGDERLGTPDRFSTFGQLGGDYRFERDFVALGRIRGASVRRTDVNFDEGQFLDISFGVALRPEATNDYGGLAKWTRRLERRALDVDLAQFQLEVSDVLSIEPFVELPYGFQVVGKGAIKVFQVLDADLPRLTSTTLLALGRLNYHLASKFDLGAEYRWTANTSTEEREHGALFEFAWLPHEYVALGVGYNFTRFNDDLLADPNLNHHGFFLRVTGRY